MDDNTITITSASGDRTETHETVTKAQPSGEQFANAQVCSVIIEPRCHKALSFVMNSVFQTLPLHIMHVFHGSENEDFARTSTAKAKIPNNCLRFHNLRKNNLTLFEYNQLLTSTSFYEYFTSEFVLIFQTDSMVFPFSPFKVTDFMDFDVYGAPWKWNPLGNGLGSNGGLSLRRVSVMKEVFTMYPYTNSDIAEDLYLGSLPVRFPPEQVAARFSVESIFYPNPFGIHKIWNYLTSVEYLKFQEYAPCVKTLFDLNQ